MSRENRGLLINFGILLVVSISFILGYGILYKNLDKKDALKEYQVYFSEATDFTEVSVDSTIISKKVEIKKGSDVIGYYFVGSEYAEGIPGHDGKDELRISVVVDKSGKFINIQTEYSEHTENFVSKLNTFYNNAKNQNIADFKNIDGEAGASAYSMPVVDKVLTEIAKNLEITVKPMVPKDPYVLVFGDYERKELDAEFVADDVLLSRELIYNDLNQVIGIAYVGTGIANGIPYHDGPAKLDLLVGLSIDGKILGTTILEHEHTQSFVDKILPYFTNLVDVSIDSFETVDLVAGASEFTMPVVQSILAKVKERFEGFDSYEEIFGVYATKIEDPNFVATDKVTKKEIILNSLNQVVGYAYTATGTAQLHDYDATLKRFNFIVGVDQNGVILGTMMLEHEHTASYVSNVIPYLDALAGVGINSYTDVDDVSGATMTLGVIKAALAEIKTVHESFDVYQYVSADFDSMEDDASFVTTDILLEKKIIKNAANEVTGYVFVGTDGIDGIPRHEAGVLDYIKLAVGVDTNGIITGVYILSSEHTERFAARIIPYLNSLVGVSIDTYTTTYNNGTEEVDGFAGASTYTKPVIVNILDAIKGVA
jgi:transcriptional regulator of nitric oxide reductase